jgi:CubicO group peptidase (beta-lactamase class C family)
MTSMVDIVAPLAKRSIDECGSPAMAWGVVADGALVASGAVGGGVDENTPFRIASMTKCFTAAIVLGLRDDGVLALDRPIAEYAPELGAVRGPDDSAPITLRHLLSMSAGLATDDPWADRLLDASAEFMNAVYASGVHFAVRTGDAFEYSNLGFAMIGRVVRSVTGSHVREHVDERLLRPLGMSNTTWDEPSRPSARPHRMRDGSAVPEGAEPLADGEIAPMGGLWSTVSDLARWVAWLDEANTGHDSGIANLRPSSRREMQTMHTYVGPTVLDSVSAPTGYGFGLLLRDDPTVGHVVGHSGGLPGYGSNMRWRKGSGVGVIGLANVTYAPMSTFTHRALTELHRAGLVPTVSLEPTALLRQRATALVNLLGGWSDEVARDLFADNVEPDEPFDRRADDARRRIGGEPIALVDVRATNRTSGTAVVSVGARTLEIEFSLSPVDGRIQEYTWKDA